MDSMYSHWFKPKEPFSCIGWTQWAGSEGRETGSAAVPTVESLEIIGHKISYNNSDINTLWLEKR